MSTQNIGSLEDLKLIDVEKIAAAIEADAGQALPGLRESLAQAKRGEFGRISTPEDILARRRGRPVGSVKENHKIQTAIRFDPEVLAALKATGRGWQTRVNNVMKEWLKI